MKICTWTKIFFFEFVLVLSLYSTQNQSNPSPEENTIKINDEINSALDEIFDLSEIRTQSRKATIRPNLHVEGNISQSAGSRLSSDIITAATQESVCIGNNLAVCPCKSLLVNKIQPIQKTIIGQNVVCSPDPQGVTSFAAHAAVWPDKQLLANHINPSKVVEYTCYNTPIEKCEADYTGTTEFGGNIIIDKQCKFSDSRILGQTKDICFNASTQTPVLLLSFKNGMPRLSTGALVNLKLFGIFYGHNSKLQPITFDAYIESNLFVGPSNESFIHQTIQKALVKIGSPHPQGTETVNTSYAAGENPLQTWVNLSIDYIPNPNEDFFYDRFDGVVYYEVIGNNINTIAAPTTN
jgi:hypothetical protein